MCGPEQGCDTATNQCFDLSPMKNMAPSPVLSTVSPPVGPSAGGIELTLFGQGFLSGAKVEIAGQLATAVEVLSSTSLKATLPARPLSRDWGQVLVSVRNPGGAIGTRNDLFGYYASHVQLDSGGLAPSVGRGGPAEGVAAADLNGDMKADFAFAAMGSSEIGVFLGDGRGRLRKRRIKLSTWHF